jgi:hypothetical protein
LCPFPVKKPPLPFYWRYTHNGGFLRFSCLEKL